MNVDELREHVRIEDYISSRLDGMEKAGMNYKCLCPFHKDKNPSMVVSPEKQIFKCFSCGVGGNIYSFVREFDGVQFRDAVSTVASFAGVQTELGFSSRKKPLYDALEDATVEFEGFRESKHFRKFQQERGISEELVETFRLGFAPRGESLRLKVNNKLGKTVGLLNDRGMSCFQNRIMFPIMDTQGRVIGFTGRDVTGSEKRPKYLNSSENSLFKKGEVLYGLAQSRNQIRREARVFVVEGQTDVLACYAEGFPVVASSGTAFTSAQARLLERSGAKEVVFVYDADEAGKEAMVKAFPKVLSVGLFVYVLPLPEGKDPDSLEDLGYFLRGRPIDWIQYIWNKAGDSQERLLATQQIASIIGALTPLEKDLYLRRAEEVTGVSYATLMKSSKAKKRKVIQKTDQRLLDAERHLFQICLNHPALISDLFDTFDVEDFGDVALAGLLWDLLESKGKVTGDDIYALFDTNVSSSVLATISGLLVEQPNPSTWWGETTNPMVDFRIASRTHMLNLLTESIRYELDSDDPDSDYLGALMAEKQQWISDAV